MNRSYIYLGVVIAAVVVALVLSNRPRVADEDVQEQAPAAQSGSNTLSGEASPATLPVPGMVTMVDLGAKSCIPCKMMEPILAELEKEYEGRAAIAFVDVSIHRNQADRFGIRAIPTQIFFDAKGREIMRHEGFMDKESITAVLKELGVS
ncbi:MAG: thioredoxin family protein [Desulfocurvibacter africanus]